MKFKLDEASIAFRHRVRSFSERVIAPVAAENDKLEKLPSTLIQELAASGFLGASIPKIYGGQQWSQLEIGLMNEEIGRHCSSARSLLTVHVSLVSETLLKCGSKFQKEFWLPRLASGKTLAAFCVTEENAGSDTNNIQGTYKVVNDGYVINCKKKYITFGQLADLFLVFVRGHDRVSAFLIERNNHVIVTPQQNLLGIRAAMVADVEFRNVWVPKENLLGREGLGLAHVMNVALDNGRFSVAFGTLGIAKEAMEQSVRFSKTRTLHGSALNTFQLTKRKLADMITAVHAAGLICYKTATLRDEQDSEAVINCFMAKYQATKIAAEITREALQLHGAAGCTSDSPLQRLFRDAKIMEIIEGSNEIQQIVISDYYTTANTDLLNV